MAKVGSPKFNVQEHLEDIEHLAGLGLNQKEICRSLGFSVSTLCKYKRISSELNEALKKGRAKTRRTLTNVLYEAATRDKNLSAAMFLLKSVFHMRDHGPLPGEEEQSHNHSVTIKYVEMDGRTGDYEPGRRDLTQPEQSGKTGENDETETDGTGAISRYGNNRNG